MGVLSVFFLADGKLTPRYDSSSGFREADSCLVKYITPLEAASIYSALCGGIDRLELLDEFHLLTPEESEEWVFSLPEKMVSALRSLEASRISAIADDCAELTAAELGWSASEFEAILQQLSALAHRASQLEKSIFLWISL